MGPLCPIPLDSGVAANSKAANEPKLRENEKGSEEPSTPREKAWERGQELNQRPSGYEPDELPDCSTPQQKRNYAGPGRPWQARMTS